MQWGQVALRHHKGAWPFCGGWRLGGGESRRVGGLLGLEVGVAPDDLDNVAEHKDKGHAADEVADEGKSCEGACGHTADGCHGVAVLVVSDHAGDRAPRKGARHQRDADNAAQEGSGKRQAGNRDNQQQDGGDDSNRTQKTAHPQGRGALVEHSGGAGGRTRKDELEQQGDKASRQGCGHDAADGVVNRRGVLVLGAVDLERADLGSCGALGVLGNMRAHGAGDAGDFTQDEHVGPDIDIAIDGLESVSELRGAVRFAKEKVRRDIGKPTFLTVNFTGSGSMYHVINNPEATQYWLESWREEEQGKYAFVMVERLRNLARPKINMDERSKLPDSIGDYLNVFDNLEKLEPAEKAKALRDILMNRPEFERLGAYGRAISDDRLLENFEKAKWLGMQRLLEHRRG